MERASCSWHVVIDWVCNNGTWLWVAIDVQRNTAVTFEHKLFGSPCTICRPKTAVSPVSVGRKRPVRARYLTGTRPSRRDALLSALSRVRRDNNHCGQFLCHISQVAWVVLFVTRSSVNNHCNNTTVSCNFIRSCGVFYADCRRFFIIHPVLLFNYSQRFFFLSAAFSLPKQIVFIRRISSVLTQDDRYVSSP